MANENTTDTSVHGESQLDEWYAQLTQGVPHSNADKAGADPLPGLLRNAMREAELVAVADETLEHDWQRLRFALKNEISQSSHTKRYRQFAALAATVLVVSGVIVMMASVDDQLGRHIVASAPVTAKNTEVAVAALPEPVPKEDAKAAMREQERKVLAEAKLRERKVVTMAMRQQPPDKSAIPPEDKALVVAQLPPEASASSEQVLKGAPGTSDGTTVVEERIPLTTSAPPRPSPPMEVADLPSDPAAVEAPYQGKVIMTSNAAIVVDSPDPVHRAERLESDLAKAGVKVNRLVTAQKIELRATLVKPVGQVVQSILADMKIPLPEGGELVVVFLK